jgi:hypothetical protein
MLVCVESVERTRELANTLNRASKTKRTMIFKQDLLVPVSMELRAGAGRYQSFSLFSCLRSFSSHNQ